MELERLEYHKVVRSFVITAEFKEEKGEYLVVQINSKGKTEAWKKGKGYTVRYDADRQMERKYRDVCKRVKKVVPKIAKNINMNSHGELTDFALDVFLSSIEVKL